MSPENMYVNWCLQEQFYLVVSLRYFQVFLEITSLCVFDLKMEAYFPNIPKETVSDCERNSKCLISSGLFLNSITSLIKSNFCAWNNNDGL